MTPWYITSGTVVVLVAVVLYYRWRVRRLTEQRNGAEQQAGVYQKSFETARKELISARKALQNQLDLTQKKQEVVDGKKAVDPSSDDDILDILQDGTRNPGTDRD